MDRHGRNAPGLQHRHSHRGRSAPALRAPRVIPWGALLPNQEKVAELQGHLSTVATSYDPETQELSITTAVVHLIVAGKEVSTDNRHRRLYNLYRSR